MSAAAAPVAPPATKKPKYKRYAIERRTAGFVAIPFPFAYELGRLTNGKIELLCLTYIAAETLSASGKDKVPIARRLKEERRSRVITIEEMAEFCGWRKDGSLGVTVEAVSSALEGLSTRKVIDRRKQGRGYTYAVPWATWSELPDYQPDKKPPQSSDELDSAEDESKDDASDTRSGVRVFAQPLHIRAGQRSKAAPVAAKVEKLQVESTADAEVEAGVTRGVLRVFIRPAPSGDTRSGVRVSRSQAVQDKRSAIFGSLHEVLDDYCRRHHGKLPDDALLGQAAAALGKATIDQFVRVWRDRIRRGVVQMAWIPLIAAEVGKTAASVPAPDPKVEAQRAAEARRRDLETLRTAIRLADEENDPLAREVIAGADPELLVEARREL